MFRTAGEIRRFAPDEYTESTEVVILIHGLFMGGYHFTPMARRLAAAGYLAVEYDYPTRLNGFVGHGKAFRKYLLGFMMDNPLRRINFVTHSMGAIVLRTALAETLPEGFGNRLGRAVLLAPPNHGSPVARLVTGLPGNPGRLWKPIAELSDSPGAAIHRVPPLTALPFGVLAARCDHLVPETSNHLDGERDYRIRPAIHTSLVFGRENTRLVINFLQTGNFSGITSPNHS